MPVLIYFLSKLFPIIIAGGIFFVPQIRIAITQVLQEHVAHPWVAVLIAIALISEPIALYYICLHKRIRVQGFQVLALGAHAIVSVILLMVMLQAFGLDRHALPWWGNGLIVVMVLKEVFQFLFVTRGTRNNTSVLAEHIAKAVFAYMSFVAFVLLWGSIFSWIEVIDYSFVLLGIYAVAVAVLCTGAYLAANLGTILLDPPSNKSLIIRYPSLTISILLAISPFVAVLFDRTIVRSADDIIEHTQATKIYLSAKDLDVVPDELFFARQAQIVRLTDNHLEEISVRIEQLSSLEELYVGNNQLRSFPDSIGTLTNLRILHAYNNRLSALPDSFTQLSSLEELQLSFNQITELPESFDRLLQLHTLNLRANKFNEFPIVLLKLEQLEYLDLAQNNIALLPENLDSLRSLTQLNIQGNPISQQERERIQSLLGDVEIIY